MEKKSEKFLEKLSEVREQIIEAIRTLIKERNIKSINFYEYWSEKGLDRYLFYDTDDDGYGMALYIESLEYNEKTNDVCLEMKDVDDYNQGSWDFDNLDAMGCQYLLTMLEDIIETADDEDNGHILSKDESFDDLED